MFEVQYQTGPCNKPFILAEYIQIYFIFSLKHNMLLGNLYIKFGNILRCAAFAGIFLIWGEQPFGAVQLFRHTVYTVKGTTLPKGCFYNRSMFNIINIPPLLQGFWCRNGCRRKGWISRGGHRNPYDGTVWGCNMATVTVLSDERSHILDSCIYTVSIQVGEIFTLS